MKLDESARELIGSGADATLVTLNPDGSPQVSVIWVAFRPTPEGDELVAAHLNDYRKTRNMRRDGRVAVTILAPKIKGESTPYLSIAGTARVVKGGAPKLSAELADAMLGTSERFPPPDAPAGFVTHIRIEKVGGSLIKPPVAWSAFDSA